VSSSTGRNLRRLAPAIVGLAVLVLVGAFVALNAQQAAGETETGVVIDIDSRGLSDVRGFTLRTTDGRTVQFRLGVLENGAAFPPGHLNEHRATATPVVVRYRIENGERVAFRIEDAPV
jgi:hypothetical protein